ncbi:nuclear transport factor 2 family protein [Nonomuraea soli]|uniref:SnoaL-like domain-containing protein n=1 Tax=Nonomuraea soli TaxID=1032476 RepID=A0A7W0HP17_9ACTN|nr:nuclear transport factor 2 family protein [Nonomuraea soli]MBA2890393.1 hypothetical protein [Nonomuraea soli]
MDAFRAAVESGDHDAIERLLDDDVVFVSPVVYKPYHGKEITTAILRAVTQVFEDFTYVRELGDESGHALVFTAKVGGRELTGCDFLRYNAEGKIEELMVMVRPLSGANALQQAMAVRLGMDSAPGVAARG